MYALDRKPIPFWVPQYRPNFIDRTKADALLPFNGKYINNHGNKAVETSLVSLAADASIGVPSGYSTNLSPFDGGLRTMRRSNFTGGSLTSGQARLRYSFSAVYDNIPAGFIELDSVPAFKGQTVTVNLTMTPYTSVTGQTVRLYGTTGAVPSNETELAALTLTTAYVQFAWASGTAARTVDISTIVQELIDNDSSWAFGKTIKLVAVNTAYATYGSGEVNIRNSEVHYFVTTVDDPVTYCPVTPIGRAYNFGGYAPGGVTIASDLGDTIDGSNVFSNDTDYNGDFVGQALDGSNYIQYTPSNFTTEWYFRDVANPNYIPEYVDIVLDMSTFASDDQIAFTSLRVEDDAGTLVGGISTKQIVSSLLEDRNKFVVRVPLDHSVLDETRLSFFKVEFQNLHITDTAGGDIRIYGLQMRPVFGQKCALNIAKLTQFSQSFAVSFLYYNPNNGGNPNCRLLQLSDSGDDNSLNFVADAVQFYNGTTPAYDSAVITTPPTGVNHCIIQFVGNTLEVYINGKLAITDVPGSVPNDNAMRIGPNNWAFSDFRVYSKSLTAAEIASISTAMFEPRPQSFTDPGTWTSPRDSVGCDPLILFLGLI